MTVTKREIIRALRMIRYSPRAPRCGRTTLGLRSLARAAGLSHMTLYRAVDTGELSNTAAAALREAWRRNMLAESGTLFSVD